MIKFFFRLFVREGTFFNIIYSKGKCFSENFIIQNSNFQQVVNLL